MIKSLIQKYNIPGPRYTSYPTVPFWDEATFTKKKWIKNSLNLPFSECINKSDHTFKSQQELKKIFQDLKISNEKNYFFFIHFYNYKYFYWFLF